MVKMEYPEGATPLDPDEMDGLLPTHITTRGELNELEQLNIADAEEWAYGRRITNVADETFLTRLHQRMFVNVWRWAGQFRTTEKNIGVSRWDIAPNLRDLCRDVKAWIKHSSFEPDEMCARFHHRLVAIHPFPDGNGRHARTAADLLLEKNLSRPRFTWGSADLDKTGDPRTRYIEALRAADQNNYEPLLDFVRS